MPRSVHVKVRNCAIASSTFAVRSWSSRMAIDVNARATATANELAEMDFSSLRVMYIYSHCFLLNVEFTNRISPQYFVILGVLQIFSSSSSHGIVVRRVYYF